LKNIERKERYYGAIFYVYYVFYPCDVRLGDIGDCFDAIGDKNHCVVDKLWVTSLLFDIIIDCNGCFDCRGLSVNPKIKKNQEALALTNHSALLLGSVFSKTETAVSSA
jgi:hypothetical protein